MKIKHLARLNILGNIRQRMGADDEADDSVDFKIDKLTNQEAVEKASAWYLGDESWAREILYHYHELERMDKESDNTIEKIRKTAGMKFNDFPLSKDVPVKLTEILEGEKDGE